MEVWKSVIGYEGYYSVSNYGNIKSEERIIQKSNGVIQPRASRNCSLRLDRNGYVKVKLSRDGASKYFSVHRLVYIAFSGDIPDGYEVDHIDYNRQNNHIENLRVVSHAENVRHTYHGGRHISQITRMDGVCNPNYGNHKLSKRYKEDTMLSKKKQSRPGAQNGMARAVRAMYSDGSCQTFDYIGDCARSLITTGLTHASIEWVAVRVSKAAKTGDSYLGVAFSFC